MKIKTTLSARQIRDFNAAILKYAANCYEFCMIGNDSRSWIADIKKPFVNPDYVYDTRDLLDIADRIIGDMQANDQSYHGNAFGNGSWGGRTRYNFLRRVKSICRRGDGEIREVEVPGVESVK